MNKSVKDLIENLSTVKGYNSPVAYVLITIDDIRALAPDIDAGDAVKVLEKLQSKMGTDWELVQEIINDVTDYENS
jgi:hypothetical protein